jgi:hypothetical protein
MARQAGAVAEGVFDGRVRSGMVIFEDEIRAEDLVDWRGPCYVWVACVVDQLGEGCRDEGFGRAAGEVAGVRCGVFVGKG